jgi:hypothetical protein
MKTLAALLILVAIATAQPAHLCSLAGQVLAALAHVLGV